MRTLITFLLVGFVVSLGCGQADDTTVSSTTGADTKAVSPAKDFVPIRATKTYDDPQTTVVDFLAAVKAGDDNAATSLLSTAAQRDAWSNGMGITTEGFPNAEFDITEVAYLKENQEAHVMCKGKDQAVTGGEAQFDCVWMLKHEPHGWTIYGMASVVDGFNVPLNFENQMEMQQTLTQLDRRMREKKAAAQIAAQQGPETLGPQRPTGQQATRPSNTTR